jgi:four helix bundle protein
MESQREQLRNRTKKFAIRILNLVDSLPKTTSALAVARQLSRCGTSVGANYRAVGRARSRAEFIAKLGVVVEEADETVFWLETLIERRTLKPALIQALLSEANELLAIVAAAQDTARQRRRTKSPRDDMIT